MAAGERIEQLLEHASRLRESGQVIEAIDAYERVLTIHPDLPDSWYNLGWLRRRARRFEAALAAYTEALKRGISRPEEVHLNRAVILADHLARPDAAEAELSAALGLNPRYVPAWLNLGNLEEDRGHRSAARAAYERALEAEPSSALALARLAGVAEITGPDDPLIERVRQVLSTSRLKPEDSADLGFALGRALDAAGSYDQAWAAYAAANADARAASGASYDHTAAKGLIDRLIRAFSTAPAVIEPQGEPPIFICGLFRSGSTLTEQILARHPLVTAGGELDLIPILTAGLSPYPEAAAKLGRKSAKGLRDTYVTELRRRHPQARLTTDKRPDNFLHIGLIKTLFPSAKIVHTAREPLDNLLSLWFLQLDPAMTYATDLADAAHWYGQYRRLMAHWKSLWPRDIFDVDYDALVADPRAQVANLLEFLGLDWDERCLAFHEANNVVKTASAWQVREPLYSRSSGRWRNYERHLGSLRAALDNNEY